jgi:glycerate dehydrogenase
VTHRIVYLQRATLDPRVVLRRPEFEHDWIEFAETPAEYIGERIAGCTIAIANKVRVSREAIARAPGLRFIAIAATGADSVDLEACRDRGIAVANVREYGKHSVSEHALMLMLATSRNLAGYQRRVAEGAWQKSPRFYLGDFPIRDLAGKTLVIVGRGVLGQATGRLGRAFDMKVVYAERKGATASRPGYVPFEEALGQADFVSLHCPLTPETQAMMGAREFAGMKPSAVLINTARGRLVDEAALIAALRERRLAAAAVDVISEEPPVNGNILLDASLPNLIVTPHVAWASAEAKQTLADELIDVIEAWERGESMNRIL